MHATEGRNRLGVVAIVLAAISIVSFLIGLFSLTRWQPLRRL